MARGKYQEWISDPDKKILLSGWARDGLTDEEIAKNIGISRSTLSEWKKKYPDISDTLKKGKEIVDKEVEESLLKKAKGYTVKLKKTFKLKKVTYGATGRKEKEEEYLEVGEDEVHIPADTLAIIFWLKNRMPDKWKDRKIEMDRDSSDGEGGGGLLILADVDDSLENEEMKEVEEADPDGG